MIRELILLLSLSLQLAQCDPVRIRVGSFNVQIFGDSKMAKPFPKHVIVNTILTYDVMLMQEIRDSDGSSISELIREVREVNPEYECVLSDRLGRSSSKEQYAYFYRTNVLTLLESLVVEDGDDVFEREPFFARFALNAASGDAGVSFGLLGCHVKPTDVVAEMQALYLTSQQLIDQFQQQDLIIMGDFNAGGRYLRESEIYSLYFTLDDSYLWAVSSAIDTTVADNDYSYDRILVHGPLLRAALAGPAVVLDLMETYNMEQESMAEISDHYPVHIELNLDPTTTEDYQQLVLQTRMLNMKL